MDYVFVTNIIHKMEILMKDIKENEIENILEKHNGNRGALISILEEIQDRYGYLPANALKILSAKDTHSLVDIYGVATFYKNFRLKPKGKHLINVCLGTACHVRGAPKVVEEFERQLDVRAGETSKDREFTLETVNCLGACALGPIVVIDGKYFSNAAPAQVTKILNNVQSGFDNTNTKTDELIFPIDVSCFYCGQSLMDTEQLIANHASINIMISYNKKKNRIWLSGLYGNDTVNCEYDIPINKIVDFFCPHCQKELTNSVPCTLCGARMVLMKVQKGGTLQICSRRGCKNHMLDFNKEKSVVLEKVL